MSRSTPVQDFDAVITWTSDWTNHLAENGDLTLTAANVDADDDRVTVAGAAVVPNGDGDAGTCVAFKVSQTGITAPTEVFLTVQVALSNGDTDERDFPIVFTNT